MSYARKAHVSSGRRGGSGRGLSGRCPGPTCPHPGLPPGNWYESGLGDTVTVTPTMQLIAQLNRFGPDAPAAYQFLTAPLASGNVITLGVATPAILIYQRRAFDSYARFQDSASKALIDKANAGMSDPVGFVSSNLPEVLTVVKSYGDSVGLPAADGATLFDQLEAGPLGVPLWGWGLGVLAAGVLYRKHYIRSQRRRR